MFLFSFQYWMFTFLKHSWLLAFIDFVFSFLSYFFTCFALCISSHGVLFIYFIVDMGENVALFLLTAWIISRRWGLGPSKEDKDKQIFSSTTFNLEYRPLGNVTLDSCWIFAEGSFYASLSIGLKQDQDQEEPSCFHKGLSSFALSLPVFDCTCVRTWWYKNFEHDTWAQQASIQPIISIRKPSNLVSSWVILPGNKETTTIHSLYNTSQKPQNHPWHTSSLSHCKVQQKILLVFILKFLYIYIPTSLHLHGHYHFL